MFYVVSMMLRVVWDKGSEITYLNKIELSTFWSKFLSIYERTELKETELKGSGLFSLRGDNFLPRRVEDNEGVY